MRAIIGGTGLNSLPGLENVEELAQRTNWSAYPVIAYRGQLAGEAVLFLPRHGVGHRLPPHRVNYRANIDALRELGATQVVGVAAVGGIRKDLGPAEVAVPHDIIDYTWGRDHTFCDDEDDSVLHIEFAPPYDEALRVELLGAAAGAVKLVDQAVLGVTQGPRLESAAEVEKLRRDGCDLVGMTGMPETALAREAGLAYASLAVVVNWAAGIGVGAIHAEIEQSIAAGMEKVQTVLSAWVQHRVRG